MGKNHTLALRTKEKKDSEPQDEKALELELEIANH